MFLFLRRLKHSTLGWLVLRMSDLHQRSVLRFYLGNVEQFYFCSLLVEDVNCIVYIQFVVLKSQSALGSLLSNLIIFPLKFGKDEENCDFYFYLLCEFGQLISLFQNIFWEIFTDQYTSSHQQVGLLKNSIPVLKSQLMVCSCLSLSQWTHGMFLKLDGDGSDTSAVLVVVAETLGEDQVS